MKIIFDETDKVCVKEYEENKYSRLFSKNGNYSLNFTISDVGKANMFLSQLFGQKDIQSLLQNEAGLCITSMNLYPAISIEFVKDKLKNALVEIEYEEQRFI